MGRRFDPRAEPDSSSSSDGPPPIIEDEVVGLSGNRAGRGHQESAPRSERPSNAPVLNGDLRLAALERRVQDNDWRGIVADLGSLQDVGRLPPNLGLFAALAHHEMSLDGDQEAVNVGVRCVAGILGVPAKGAMANVIARRLFRRNPVRFRERKAPPARISTLIIAGALVLGGGAGWLSSGGVVAVRGFATHLARTIAHPARR